MKKQTLTQQFSALVKEIEEYKENIKKALLKDIPEGTDTVYQVKKGNGEKPCLSERKISNIRVLYPILNHGTYMSRPTINKRASQRDIDRLREYFDYLKNCYVQGKTYLMFIFNPVSKTNNPTTAYFPSDFHKNDGNYIYFFDKSKALEEFEHCLDVYEKFYKKKEGYIPCTYCGKQIMEKDVLWVDILERGSDGILKLIRFPFCSQECIRHKSMSIS